MGRVFPSILAALFLGALPADALAERAEGVHPMVYIGVDGVEPSVLADLWSQGKLPNLSKLKERGLYTTIDTAYGKSPVIWTTVATGVAPELHGITDFTISTDSGDQPVSSTARQVPAIWNMVSAHEMTVTVLGWWGSWPAEPVNGIIITDRARKKGLEGRVSPDSYLAGYERELTKVYATKAPAGEKLCPADQDRMIAHFAPQVVATGFDLSMVYLRGTDGESHKYWRYYRPTDFPEPPDAGRLAEFANKVPDAYEAMDFAIGHILAAAPVDANIIIMSDHGMGPAKKEVVKPAINLDRVLEQIGFLEKKGEDVVTAKSKIYTSRSADFQGNKAVKYGGLVAEDQREAVRAELVEALAKVTYESGTPVFLVRDFKGPSDRGDFIVEVQKDKPTKVVLIDGVPYDKAVTDLSFLSGGHNDNPSGVFFAAGPDIDPAADLSGLSIKDITPTMLYALGLPVGDDFVGSAYTHLFNDGYQSTHSLESIESWGAAVTGSGTASEMDEELLEDLRSLGYIE